MPSGSERQADVRAAFAQWAQSQAGCPRDVSSLVEDVERADEHLGMLRTELQGRRAVWKTIASASKSRVTFPAISVESIDAWTADEATVRARSDHVAVCETCGGVGKTTCDACSGGGKLTCSSCNGERKMYGYAANGSRRLLNCQTCRGKGELDCGQCRRGVASCSICAGGGHVQRWIELESWRRTLNQTHPESIARGLGWPPNVLTEDVTRDAVLLLDVDRPQRLSLSELGVGAMQWLSHLAPALQPGERIARQQLRIARLPIHTIRYRLGNTIDRVPFTGHRLIAPPPNPLSAFSERASKLRSLRWLLLLTFLVILLFSLARGWFYWSVPTLFSLIAAAGALIAIHGGIAEWTAARRATHRWMLASAMFVVIAIACAVAAMPRAADAERLIAAGRLDEAERALNALRDDAAPNAWADLRLARIGQAPDVASARAVLAQIPSELPQHARASVVTGHLLARDAGLHLRDRRWNDAANAIIAARDLGLPESDWKPLADVIGAAGVDAVESASRRADASTRLAERIEAESILVAWERASGTWGTPPLIALRTAMARDVAALEKAARRRAS